MNKGNSIVLKKTLRLFHIRTVVLVPHVLHYADGDHAVIFSVYIAIIIQPDLHRESPAHLLSEFNLLFGNCNPRNRNPVFFGCILRKSAPPAPEVEDSHPLLQTCLPAYQIQLGFLRVIQGFRVLPVAARVYHPPVQHCFVKIVADIVVLFAYLEGATHSLQVKDS